MNKNQLKKENKNNARLVQFVGYWPNCIGFCSISQLAKSLV